MKAHEKKRSIQRRWPWIIGGFLLCIVLWNLFAGLFQEEEKELRRQLRENVKEKFPIQTAQFSETIGLFSFESGRPGDKKVQAAGKTVVLIHGLDDPGKVWQNLAPELTNSDFDVWLMHYPNDQPIVESTRLFYEELQKLRQHNIRRISIVAHSMGGLISRDLLTNPEIDYTRSMNNNLVPVVDTLIMVGTPNHGSQLVRLRAFGELRDHLARLTKGEVNWLGFILDGAGEAKIDLLPGSRFLAELNVRKYPEGVDMMIIAGITSPWDESDIDRSLGSLRQKIPGDRHREINAFAAYLTSMTHGLGDGLVTVESTRLQGVPHQTVSGTHLSMIRNITQSSTRIPPAIPIIVDRLKKE